MPIIDFLLDILGITFIVFGLYLLFITIISYFNYQKLIKTTKGYEELYYDNYPHYDTNLAMLSNMFFESKEIMDFERFKYLCRKGIKLVSIGKEYDFFVNILEGHFISPKLIVIDGLACIPSSFIQYLYIISYLTSSDDIEYHFVEGKYSDSSNDFYESYRKAMLYIMKNEFPEIDDVIAIEYSAELGNEKAIWESNNIIYMHGYNTSPIAILIACVYFSLKKEQKEDCKSSKKIERKDIIQRLTGICKRVSHEEDLYTFIEENPESIVNDVINSIESQIVDPKADYILPSLVINYNDIETKWMYSSFANSVWKYHEHMDTILSRLESERKKAQEETIIKVAKELKKMSSKYEK